jgi:hypothetical protein
VQTPEPEVRLARSRVQRATTLPVHAPEPVSDSAGHRGGRQEVLPADVLPADHDDHNERHVLPVGVTPRPQRLTRIAPGVGGAQALPEIRGARQRLGGQARLVASMYQLSSQVSPPSVVR